MPRALPGHCTHLIPLTTSCRFCQAFSQVCDEEDGPPEGYTVGWGRDDELRIIEIE